MLLHEVQWHVAEPAPPQPRDDSRSLLIGRDPEIAILRRAVDDALAGHGHLVLLAGEPGIGKTTLATDATTYAATRGARTLWGACWEGEGAPAFWPWIQ